jgi:SAM-dependent methyltransferase
MVETRTYADAWRAYVLEESTGSHPLYRFAVSLLIELGSFSRVLDLGCGTAGLASEIAASGVKLERYAGIDANAALLDYCRETLVQNAEFFAIDLATPREDDLLVNLISASDAVVSLRLFNNIEDQALGRLLALIKAAGSGRKFLYLCPFYDSNAEESLQADPLRSLIENEEFNGVTVTHFQRTPKQYAAALLALGYSDIRTASFKFPPATRITHWAAYGVI